MNTFFSIISPNRSGSHFLGSLLNSHPNVLSMSEIFTKNAWKTDEKYSSNKNIRLKDFVTDVIREKKEIFISNMPDKEDFGNIKEKTVFGGLIKTRQFKSSVLSLLQNYDFKIIYLDRKNIIERELSHYIANILRKKSPTNEIHYRTEVQINKIFFTKSMQMMLKRRILKEKRLDKKAFKLLENVDKLSLEYDDIIDSNNDISFLLCDFFSIPRMNLKASLIKNKYSQPHVVIKNYKEVINFLEKEFRGDDDVYKYISKIMDGLDL